LDVEGVDEDLEGLLSGAARKFRPHITLRGRFVGSGSTNLEALASLFHGVALPSMIDLAGPVLMNPSLAWLECLPGERGYHHLLATHGELNQRLAMSGLVSEDRTPAEQAGVHFRPHLTLSWEQSSRVEPMAARRLTVRGAAITAYSYVDNPLNDLVTRHLLGEAG
jgi:2'-5' RNA ligase